jgi:hypothetical protein
VPHDLQLRCPICGANVTAVTHPEYPFCSERCRLLDLANWATERYVISEPAADQTLPSTESIDDDA